MKSLVCSRINCRNFYARMIAALSVTAIAATAFPTSGPDPNPGPADTASTEATIAPRDIATPENTQEYPPRREPRVPWQPAQSQPTGALTGRIIYVSAGHGYQILDGTWKTERPTYQFINEDLGNQDQLTQFVYQAFNAGATIVPMRPVGNQTNEVVLDNDDPQVTYTGSWSNSTGTPAFGSAGDAVKYRFSPASATETATARYTPNIPQPGYYPVYSWVLFSNNRNIDQLYRVKHSGGISEVRVNHRKVGKGWVYLGTYYFEQGTGGYCEISNQSSSPAGSNAIADGIRFGNGIGPSGKPREEEAAKYWIQAMAGVGAGAAGSSIYSGNVAAPLRMASHMNNETQGVMLDRVYLSFHSNGSNGSARGAIGLWNDERIPRVPAGTKTPNQEQLAILQGREVNLDMRGIGSPPLEHPWSTRTSHHWSHTDYAFGEIRWDTVNHEMDATINEVAFHDNAEDATLLGNSNARIWISRASLQGLIRYFNQFGSGPLNFAPEPPINVKAIANANGTITVTWTPPAATSIGGQPPTGYTVYTSTNGYGFGNPVQVSGINTTQATISNATPGQPLYLRVSSNNAGGESLPTEVLGVRPTPGALNNTLVVYGFDRMDRATSPRETNTGLTTFYRAQPWRTNNYDYIVQHGNALHNAGYGFDSTSNEAVTIALLNNYKNVIWILGAESTVDRTFNATEQASVTSFLNNPGKNFLVTGSEVGWDLDQANNGRSFYRNTLGVTFVSDSAATYNITGGTDLLASVSSFSFGPPAVKTNNTYPPPANAPYDVGFPDVIRPTNTNGSAILSYSGGATAAVRTVRADNKIVVFGFPFETIINVTRRNQIMKLIMDDFNTPPSSVTDWSVY